MKKRLSYEEKKSQALKDIINKMFEIAGHEVRYDDLIGRTDDWYFQYTMAEEQCDQWMLWSQKYLMKTLKYTSETAKKEMSWLNLTYGLKISKES